MVQFLAGHELPADIPTFDYDEYETSHEFPPRRIRLSADDVKAYAAATGDTAALERLATGGESAVAPSTMLGLVGLLKLALGAHWPESSIHARQEFEFVRPLRLDVELTLRARIGEKLVKRGRRYLVIVLTVADERGDLIGVSRNTLVFGEESE